MLKIKDDFDLKGLEKFGFEYYDRGEKAPNGYPIYGMIREIGSEFDIFVWGRTKELEFHNYGYPDSDGMDELANILFDLITAVIVEKVEE